MSTKRRGIQKETTSVTALDDSTNMLTKKFSFFNTFDWIVITNLSLILFIYVITNVDFVNWSLTAIGRISLIKLLHIFDWRNLKNKQCLLEHFTSNGKKLENNLFNCDLCENIKKIDLKNDLDQENLERYIELDIPIILTDSLPHWPNDSRFINDLVKDESFGYSYPCKLSTNIFKNNEKISDIFKNIEYFNSFFLHFQNCDHDAMRTLRRFTFRPEVLPQIYSPVTYNWLIWNRNYNTTVFKMVDLVEKITGYGQVDGASYLRLIPRNNCEHFCSMLEFKLEKHQMVVFTSLWDLEYKPVAIGENLAVILEIKD